MKKILLILTILISANICYSFDLKDVDIKQYFDTPYFGMPYEDALDSKQPFILVLAKPNNVYSMAKFIPVGEMVYNDFKGKYNFCVINVKVKENKEILEFFHPKKLPAVYIIDTQNKTYTFINKKYYNKKDIKIILTKFKNGTLFR